MIGQKRKEIANGKIQVCHSVKIVELMTKGLISAGIYPTLARTKGKKMSLFSKIAGFFNGGEPGGKAASVPEPAGKPEIYKDLLIQAEPISEGGQWRLAGRIRETAGENPREHHFIRADVFSNRNDAIDFAIRKGRQMIDEQGRKLFD